MPSAAKATPHRAGLRGRIVCYPGFLVLAGCCKLDFSCVSGQFIGGKCFYRPELVLKFLTWEHLFGNFRKNCEDRSIRNSPPASISFQWVHSSGIRGGRPQFAPPSRDVIFPVIFFEARGPVGVEGPGLPAVPARSSDRFGLRSRPGTTGRGPYQNEPPTAPLRRRRRCLPRRATPPSISYLQPKEKFDWVFYSPIRWPRGLLGRMRSLRRGVDRSPGDARGLPAVWACGCSSNSRAYREVAGPLASCPPPPVRSGRASALRRS